MRIMNEDEFIKEIAVSLVNRKCALFCGSGFTVEGGGATWGQLLDFLKNKYNYDSPLKNEFDIMSDLCKKHKKENIYKDIQERLKNIKITDSNLKLTSFPWYTTFTTNYDTVLEDSLDKSQKDLQTRRIVEGTEFFLDGIQSEILCVKLMGSVDRKFNCPGHMILDIGDLTRAKKERDKIFIRFADNAANLSFLFVGYSFDDSLFTEILDLLLTYTGELNNKYYAVFIKKPNPDKEYLLNMHNIEYLVIEDLQTFIKKLGEEYSKRNPKDFSQKKLSLGNDIIIFDSKKTYKFLSFYNPILTEDLEGDIEPFYFFKGDTNSLKPFSLNWHFPRTEIKKVINGVLSGKKNKSNIIELSGNPGEGRTYVILASIVELINKHNSIAIRLQNHKLNIIPDIDSLKEFINEIENKIDKQNGQTPERIILFADFSLEIEDIIKYQKLSLASRYPVSLVFESMSNSIQTLKGNSDFSNHIIEIDKELPLKQKEGLANYIKTTVQKHKFPEIDLDNINEIIKEEERFFPIMYRIIHPTRRSIDTIVSQEFSDLPNEITRDCILFISMASSLDLDMPLAVLKNALSEHHKTNLSYKNIFELIDNNSKAFVKRTEDKRTNPIASIYHSLIATYLIGHMADNAKSDKLIIDIGKSVDLISRIEGDFIGHLFINKGVNWGNIPGMIRPFSDKGLEQAFIKLKERQPARPILHHLARLYEKQDINDKRIIPLLEDSLATPKEDYSLNERKENILTTMARIKWKQNKNELIKLPRKSREINEIFGLLNEAKEEYMENIHPYDVHARILHELMQTREGIDKYEIANEAIEVIDEGLDYSDDQKSIERLGQLLIEILSEVDVEKAEECANDLFKEEKNGVGFYTLARIEYHKNEDSDKALGYLQKATESEKCPNKAFALYIEILLKDDDLKDYFQLEKLVKTLNSKKDFIDTWKSAYHKGTVNVITGNYSDAVAIFRYSHKKTPFILQRYVNLFWMEGGHRKKFEGRIRYLSEREGRIEGHNIEGWQDNFFFDPRRQGEANTLMTGLTVNFEIGFSPRGPQAFDVRPIKR